MTFSSFKKDLIRRFMFFFLSFSLSPFLLYSSGLSYEESKELTKADLNQDSARPQSPSHQTGPVAQALEESKCTKDSSLTDAPAKDVKPAQTSSQEPLKALPAQKEPVFTAEPMKTRRSQYAEDRKMNTTANTGLAAAVRAPEVEKRGEWSAACTVPEKEHKEDMKEEKTERSQLSVDSSPPPKASSELKEVQSVSMVKPAAESEEIISEPSGSSEPLKRKSLSEIEGELTPEKRPRMSSVSSVSSFSSASPSASSISSPATPTSTTSQRVPPLKVGINVAAQSLLRSLYFLSGPDRSVALSFQSWETILAEYIVSLTMLQRLRVFPVNPRVCCFVRVGK